MHPRHATAWIDHDDDAPSAPAARAASPGHQREPRLRASTSATRSCAADAAPPPVDAAAAAARAGSDGAPAQARAPAQLEFEFEFEFERVIPIDLARAARGDRDERNERGLAACAVGLGVFVIPDAADRGSGPRGRQE